LIGTRLFVLVKVTWLLKIQMEARYEYIGLSTAAAAAAQKIIEKMEKKGMDKREQLEHLLFKMENENDMETHRGMSVAYYELCAKYDIHDARPREHKRRLCFC
jgi:hypothetical protein